MKRAQIETFFARLAAATPTPSTELNYNSDYQLLVAVVLSAQATDVSVNRATRGLFEQAPTPQAMLALGENAVREQIRTIGLFRTKAKNVVALSKLLIEQHGGQVPANRNALQALPGVGRKTANVVLNTAFGEATIAVDTHIFRVANRTGLAPGKNVDAVEAALMRRVPTAYQQHAHHWLILHGRYTCTARKPHCTECIVYEPCGWPEKNTAVAAHV